MSETGPMTPAEMRSYREFLGFTAKQLADHFGVQERAVLRYENGDRSISAQAADAVRSLLDDQSRVVAATVARLREEAEPLFALPQDPEDYPAAWWRRVAARVALELPALRIMGPH